MSGTAENDASYMRGMCHALAETLEYLRRYGTEDLDAWLSRRHRAWEAAAEQATRVIPPEEGAAP